MLDTDLRKALCAEAYNHLANALAALDTAMEREGGTPLDEADDAIDVARHAVRDSMYDVEAAMDTPVNEGRAL